MQSGHPSAVIYALLPVASDEQQWLLASNDVDCNSTLQVYQQFVRHCVETSKSIDIICRPWAPQNDRLRDKAPPGYHRPTRPLLLRRATTYGTLPKEDRLPSWIRQVNHLPFGDGGKTGRKNGDILVGYGNRRFYDAAKGSRAVAVFGRASSSGDLKLDGSMIVNGFIVNPVQDLGFRATGGTIYREWIEKFGWQQGDSFVQDHIWRTLVADRGPGGMPVPMWYNQACRYWLDFADDGDVTSDMIRDTQHPSMAIEYIQRVRNVIWNRTLIITTDHTGGSVFGLGPQDTKVDDYVCILHGCSVPVILRQEEDYWLLIGECFVYSLMDGEAMGVSQYTAKTQEFMLR
jgi:hypothetical protein